MLKLKVLFILPLFRVLTWVVDLGQEVKSCFHSYTILIAGLKETPLEAQPPEPMLLRLEEGLTGSVCHSSLWEGGWSSEDIWPQLGSQESPQ